jgi:hypothetical protein
LILKSRRNAESGKIINTSINNNLDTIINDIINYKIKLKQLNYNIIQIILNLSNIFFGYINK